MIILVLFTNNNWFRPDIVELVTFTDNNLILNADLRDCILLMDEYWFSLLFRIFSLQSYCLDIEIILERQRLFEPKNKVCNSLLSFWCSNDILSVTVYFNVWSNKVDFAVFDCKMYLVKFLVHWEDYRCPIFVKDSHRFCLYRQLWRYTWCCVLLLKCTAGSLFFRSRMYIYFDGIFIVVDVYNWKYIF